MSVALQPLILLKGRIQALIEVLRGAIQEKTEDAAFAATTTQFARDFSALASDLPNLPRALELASDIVELVALLLLLKSARLLDCITRPTEDPDARAALLALIKKKAELLRETIDARFLPLRPVHPPQAAPDYATGPTALLESTHEVISLDEIADTLAEVLAEMESPAHQVVMDRPTVQEMIQKVLRLLAKRKRVVLQNVWGSETSERVASFLAVLDLAFQHKARMEQEESGARVYITAVDQPMTPAHL